ncbi:MAG: dethiobiotin synthase [Flavobacteriaceae bacterium]
MNKQFFITGIGTDVGKTVVAAILTEALEADYWKPVQAGDLDTGDAHAVEKLISNEQTTIHSNSYGLKTPMSPHAAAKIDGVTIDVSKITPPITDNHLVIEGAGGVLVPLNDSNTILDLIQPDYKVIVVSRHYLGSINHSLMTIQLLQSKGFEVYVIFNGEAHQSTEDIIEKMTGVTVLGRIDEEPYIDKNVVKTYAEEFQEKLQNL